MTTTILCATETVRAIEAGTLTAERLVRTCLARIEAREPIVGAFSHLAAEAALAEARALDAGPRRGLLHGLPVGVKDVIDTFDQPTQYGSPIYAGHRPVADAGCVATLRAAGAIILGKTVTTEFATREPGRTTNPHDPAFTPGGSSSGSAAAVADGMLPLAVGTQTGGSVIRPAAFCGVVGYKPTFGTVVRQGVKQVSESLDTVGGFGQRVADAALVVAAMAGQPSLARVTPHAPKRVALRCSFEWKNAKPETVAAIDAVAARLRSAGVEVSVQDLPDECRALAALHPRIEYFEIARAMQHEYRMHRAGLSATLIKRVEDGLAIADTDYLKALAETRRCRAIYERWTEGYDFILTASAAGEAPRGLASTGNAMFNKVWTLLGVPCITLPGGRGPNGLPVGVQMVGRFGADAELIGRALWLEEVLAAGR
jgi:Asp-tRNA(Asn)/Glu-tRNA(Gln) amidotransferase A subunit family amidase